MPAVSMGGKKSWKWKKKLEVNKKVVSEKKSYKWKKKLEVKK